MMKKGIIGIVILAAVILAGTAGIHRYLESNTILQYGQIPDDTIPKQFDKVTYTIPTIDEEGNRSTQTFTVSNEKELGKIVKLVVRNDKVKKHEFINIDDIPDKVKRNLPVENF